MGNTLRRVRELGYATAMALAAALAFGTLAPASAVEATGSISGTVTLTTGGLTVPAEHTYVALWTSNYDWAGSTTIDANGDYSFVSLPDDSYKVEFSPASAGHVSEFYNNAPDFGSATRVDVSGGAAVAGIDANLEESSTISGTVTSSIDGGVTPAAGVTVDVYSADDHSVRGSRQTEADGSYSFNGLPAGTYKVGFSGEGTIPSVLDEYYNDAPDLASAAAIELGVGATVSGIDATLAQGSTITGTVTTLVADALVPPGDMQIDAYSAAGDYITTVYPDVDGSYALGSLSAGGYKLHFYPYSSELLPEYFDNAANIDSAAIIEVGDRMTVSGIDAVLARASTLSGTVSQSVDGVVSGAANVSIDVYSAAGDYVTNRQTDSEGAYTIGSLPAGSYKLGFQSYSYGSALLPEFYDNAADLDSAQAIVVGAGATVSGLDATLAQGSTITGTVSQDTDGVLSGAENIYVSAYETTSRQWSNSVSTAADGSYALTPLEAGSYVLRFSTWESDLLGEYYNDALDMESATPIEVGTSATVSGIDATLARGATISGTVTKVVDGAVVPAEGVSVSADATNGFGAGTWTDGNGDYVIRGLIPEDYKVGFNDYRSGLVSEYYDNALTWDSATNVPVGDQATVSGIDAALADGATISGTVSQDIDGVVTGAADVNVEVYSAGNERYVSSRSTDSDGNYSIGSLPAGSYKVGFSASGGDASLLPEYFDDVSTLNAAKPIVVAAAATAAGIDATLSQGSTITGTVSRTSGDAVLPAEEVYVRAYSATTGDEAGYTFTRADGSYAIGSLPAGSYKLEFDSWGSDLLREYYNDASTLASATTVELGSRATVSGIDATLAQGGTITGTVTRTLGDALSPAANVYVTAYSATTGRWAAQAWTNSSGSYSLRALPAGGYRLEFATQWGSSLLGEYYDDASTLTSAKIVDVGAAATVPGIDATLATGGTISGTVTKTIDGAPAAGIDVMAHSADGSPREARTNAAGHYSIVGLPVGTYTLEYTDSASGLLSEYFDNATDFGSATTIDVGPQENVVGIDADLALGGAISGHVDRSISGEVSPAADVRVSVYSPEGWHVGSRQTDAAGNYSVGSLPAGAYAVRFSSYGSGLVTEYYDNAPTLAGAKLIDVGSQATVTGIDATLEPGSTISGTVTKDIGGSVSPAANVWVSAFSGDGDYADGSSTNDDGTYSFDALPAGSYVLQFESSEPGAGLAREYYNDAPDLASATPVSVGTQQTVSGIDATLTEGSTISGTVTQNINGSLSPAIGVYVTAYSVSDGRAVGSWGTDSTGEYQIGSLSAGTYKVGFGQYGSSTGLVAEFFDNVSDFDSATTITVAAASGVSGIDAELSDQAPMAPVVGATPTISGTTTEGQTLTANAGAWSPQPVELTYQWSRGGTPIEGATGSTYLLVPADEGQNLTVTVTGNKPGYVTESKTSTPTAAIAVAPKAFTAAPVPTISGTTTEGQTLTAAAGSWTPATVSLDYQWSRGGSAISGATSATYLLVPADEGQTITVTVTGSKLGYITQSKTSAPTAVIAVAPKPFTAAPVPTISGTTTEGQTLTAAAGSWTPGPVELTYQWSRGGSAITGATSATYLLVPADEGQTLTVTVTGNKSGYITQSKTSAPTAAIAVAPKPFTAAPVPTISGTTTEGQTLTAAAGSWTPATVSLDYQWSRGSTAISGATNATYLLVPADEGQTITVTVTGSKLGYITQSKTSTPTAAIAVAPKPFTAAPVPTISGTTTEGQTLTAAAGSWTPSPVTLAYQWSRGGTAIGGATDSTYLLVPADEGQTLTVTVTGTQTGYITQSTTSAPTAAIAVAPKPFTAAPVPTISGTTTEGQTLTADAGSWTPSPVTLAYQWSRGGTAIDGATSASYLLVPADEGQTITVTVTGSQVGYITQPKTSVPTAAIAAVPKPFTAAPIPTISGTTRVGSTLTVTSGIWSPAPVTLEYQWYEDGLPLTDATGETYTLTSADLGMTLTVEVTGSATGSITETTTSAPTAAITSGALATPPVPTITGTLKGGNVLTANAGTWAPAPVTLAYKWYRSGVLITGATSQTYTLMATDVGKTMKVRVTGSKSGYISRYKDSVSTVAITTGTLKSVVPTVTGTAKVGSVLTAAAGTWGPGTVTLTYQWYRTGVLITGATAKTYTLASADLGKTMTVKVTGSKSGATTVVKTSVATVAVVAGTLTTATPTITGTVKVGSALTANPGTWGPATVTLKYQWYRTGVAITGATAKTYTLTSTDRTKTMTVKVTGSKSGYTTVSKTSAASVAVAAGTLTTATPTITGTLKSGYTLTANPGTWGPATVTLKYQWYRSGVAISGATLKTYKLVSADRYDTIKVRVVGSKTGYTSVTKYSASTVKIP